MRHKNYLPLIFVLALIAIFFWNWAADQKMQIAAQKTDLPKQIIGKDGAGMVLIPAGEFEMGTDSSEVSELTQWAKTKAWYSETRPIWVEDEVPRHTVYLDAFYMDRYEVTNALYKKFMDATGHKAPEHWDPSGFYNLPFDSPDQPVAYVSWDDAKAYAEWAGKRLPTEAEWEKAARGGLLGKKYPWGAPDPDGSQCNFADRNALKSIWSDKSVDDGYQEFAPVGSFPPNGYGLHDMAGNAFEWCADWYDRGYYANSPNRNPTGPGSGKVRVVRGGSWSSIPNRLRVAKRGGIIPTYTSIDLGFRCGMSRSD
jgi:iron(II)-dependent oxidoreductase